MFASVRGSNAATCDMPSSVTAETKIRQIEIERELLNGRGLPQLRRWVADRYELSDRQARHAVRQAALKIKDDWEIQRQDMLAHRLTQLEALAEKALSKDQLAVALGCWKHADNLMGIADIKPPKGMRNV